MYESTPYYPDYDIIRTPRPLGPGKGSPILAYEVTVLSKLRMKHTDDIWYTCLHVVRRRVEVPPGKLDELVDVTVKEFVRNVYLYMKFGVVDPSIENMHGIKVYPKDKLQISEEERLGLKQ